MNKETQSIIRNLQNVLTGTPWYGRAINILVKEVDPSSVHKKPNENSHSLIELLYHMITWAEFTLKSLEMVEENEINAVEKMDWREIDPVVHSWEKGMAEFKVVHEKIIQLLKEKDDEFLKEKVNFRDFNYRFLLNGLIQHNIYHAGQVAYLKKQLD